MDSAPSRAGRALPDAGLEDAAIAGAARTTRDRPYDGIDDPEPRGSRLDAW